MAKVYAYVTGEYLGDASPELEESAKTAIESVVGAAWDRNRRRYMPATLVDAFNGMAITVRVGSRLRLV